jgi:glutathione S-transferase
VGLTFYYGAGSPYAWRVFLALEHKQVPYERTTVSFSARDTHKPAFRAMNPRGKVPVIDDDGFVLYESAAIIEYLDERFPDAPRLFPADVRDRAIVRRLVREADTYAGRDVSALGSQLFARAVEQREPDVIERAAAALGEELASWERAITGDYLHGTLTAADFTLYPLLAMIARFEKRKPELGLAARLGPRTNAWMRRIESLPYFDKTYPEHWRAS